MNIHTNAKIKQFLLNVVLILLAFTIQNCVFPLLPFLAATPNLLLILTFSFGFIHGKGAGMLYGVLSGLLLDLFYSGPTSISATSTGFLPATTMKTTLPCR